VMCFSLYTLLVQELSVIDEEEMVCLVSNKTVFLLFFVVLQIFAQSSARCR
jgi:hypothetical protein